jgi:transposase-like protein
MAERRTRRRFTAEFKTQAVERLLGGGKPLSEVATELGLSPGQLSQWRNEHLAAGSAAALAARTLCRSCSTATSQAGRRPTRLPHGSPKSGGAALFT